MREKRGYSLRKKAPQEAEPPSGDSFFRRMPSRLAVSAPTLLGLHRLRKPAPCLFRHHGGQLCRHRDTSIREGRRFVNSPFSPRAASKPVSGHIPQTESLMPFLFVQTKRTPPIQAASSCFQAASPSLGGALYASMMVLYSFWYTPGVVRK